MASSDGKANGNGGDNEDNNRLQYQFKIDRDTWYDWKMTVPRDMSLDERIIELIEEDLEEKST